MPSLHLVPDDDKPRDPREQAVHRRSPLADDLFDLACHMNRVASATVIPLTPRSAVDRIADEDGQLTMNLLVEVHGVEKVYRYLETAAVGYGITLPILPPTGERR